jgi:hypothetical protein
MDLDAMAKQVDGLKNFRRDAEEAVAFYHGLKLAGFKMPDASTVATDGGASVSSQLDDITRRLAVVEGDQSGNDSFADRLTSIETKLSALNTPTDTASIEQRLSALEGSKEEAAAFSDRLTTMLEWFEANKDGLDVLLSLDGIPDEPEPVAEAPAETADAPQTTTTTEVPAAAPDAPGTVQG